MWRVVLFLLCLSGPALTVEPDEILTDPVLEARARAISAELRCPVCRNENIDNSGAQIAKDLRLLVRERLVAGDSDQQVIDFIVARYNEFVLLKPPAKGSNLLLWGIGPLLLLVGGGLAYVFVRRNSHESRQGVVSLNEAEEHRLKEILKE